MVVQLLTVTINCCNHIAICWCIFANRQLMSLICNYIVIARQQRDKICCARRHQLRGRGYLRTADCDDDDEIEERIQFDASDLRSRWWHQCDLTNKPDESQSTIRIWPDRAIHCVSQSWSDDKLDVCLPIWSDDLDEVHNLDPRNDAQIYGDKCNGMLHDYESSLRFRTRYQ
jgi:hypothetical protein